MLGIVIPLKPRNNSKNWEYDSLLFERTLNSVCGQLDSSFMVFVVHNEKPLIECKHTSVKYLFFDLPYINATEIHDFDDYVSLYYKPHYAEIMMDKSRKIMFGFKEAKKYRCTYLMSLDSDDLISNRLSMFVNQNSNALRVNGWRLRLGYVYREGDFLMIKSRNIQIINGSTHIVRSDLVEIPDFSSKKLWDYNLFESHGYTYQRLIDFGGNKLSDCDFFSVIYVVHEINSSQVKLTFFGNLLKRVAKYMLSGSLVSQNIKSEFGIYKLN